MITNDNNVIKDQRKGEEVLNFSMESPVAEVFLRKPFYLQDGI